MGLFYYTRAVLLLEVGEYDDAAQAFGLVIRTLPEFAQAYHGRGLAYYHEERLELALEDFDRAIELKPGLADAYKDRGRLYADEGESEKAIADLRKALSLYDPIRGARRIDEVRTMLAELGQ